LKLITDKNYILFIWALILTRQLDPWLQFSTRTNKGACPLVKKEMFIFASLIPTHLNYKNFRTNHGFFEKINKISQQLN